MLRDYKDFAEYICNNYQNARKIIEVGIGSQFEVFKELKKSLTVKIIATDINPNSGEVLRDDISKPDMEIYKNADLIYAIRPPLELYPYLEKVACDVKADLIIRPLLSEGMNRKEGELINYKKAIFYLYRG